ncbi:MAG: hypothetical protein EBX50_17805, partial [Chitinophagia bacterium]|nr:hypothetical protein [Chitinophagia bacterium]
SLAEETEQKDKAKLSTLSQQDWSKQNEDIYALNDKYDFLINVLQVLSFIPIPVGNPFSMALAGESIAKGDTLGAVLNVMGAMPGLGSFAKAINLAKSAVNSPAWIGRLLHLANRLGIYSIVKPAIDWLARSIANINLYKIFKWDFYKKYALTNTKYNFTLYFFDKARDKIKKDSSSHNYSLLSFANEEEMVPSKNVETAQQELKNIGKNLQKIIDKVDMEINPKGGATPAAGMAPAASPPSADLIINQKADSLRKKNFKSLTSKDLKDMIENPSKYRLSSTEVDIAQQELDDREIDTEIGSGRY